MGCMDRMVELRRSIAFALGIVPATLGCADRQLVDDAGEDGSAEGSGSAEDDGASESTTGVMSTSDTTTVGSSTSTGTTTVGSSTVTSVSTSVGTDTATATSSSSTDTGTELCPPPMDYLEWYGCVPAPPDGLCGECDEACQQALAIEYQNANGGSCWYVFGQVLCGPDAVGDTCCFLIQMYEEGCGEGRPYVCAGRAVTADAAARADWAAALVDVPPDCTAAQSRALADSWLASALAEHASVASFARFVLDLLAMGAPPELVADAQRAMGEEIEHARLCFALAHRYGGEAIGPGPLPTIEEPRTAADIVRAAVLEGCVGETISATEVAIARDRASDPLVRSVLDRIAEEEQRHAVLAWRFVRWAIEAQPELAAIAREAFTAALSRPVVPSGEIGDAVSTAHGRLGASERAEIANDVRIRVVGPCAADLLRAGVARAAAPARARATPTAC